MFVDLEDFINKVKNQKIEVAGIGVSNLPLIDMLLEIGALVTAHDEKEWEELGPLAAELKKRGVTLKLGAEYLTNLSGTYLFKSPGIRFDLPPILEYVKKGGKLTSEMETFFDLCPARIIGVTGSDGKTTTTTLIAKLLEAEGYTVHLGGNIGKPLLAEVEKMNPEDWAVVELSSFQLHTMKRSPQIAVITNITPNHLDMHKSMTEYIEAKKNIATYQEKNDLLIVNYDNEITRQIGEESSAKVRFFSRKNPLTIGASLQEDFVTVDGSKVLFRDDIRLPGLHNVENYMAAYLAVKDYVKPETLLQVAGSFEGVAHRIEFIRELGKVRYYNDSIASSPTRTQACLNAFFEDGKKIILIAGGYDKKIPFDGLGQEIVEKTKCAYLVGDTATKIAHAIAKVDPNFPVSQKESLKEALTQIKQNAQPGDIVVLSPACASFDLYKNFEDRGNIFKELVKEL